MRIRELEPGRRFALAALPHRVGELRRLGESSAVVVYGGPVTKNIEVKRGEEVVRRVSFKASGKPTAIALETEVVAL